MRIPFPERVNLPYTLAFATAMFCVQVLEGTHVFFAGCVFCYILVAAIGFNIAGGIVGGLIGTRSARHLSERRGALNSVFAAVIIAVALYMLARNISLS